MVVTPARRYPRSSACRKCAAVPASASSAPRGTCGMRPAAWVCASVSPGITVRCPASSGRAPGGHGCEASPTCRMTPSCTRTAAPSRTGAPVPSNSRTLVSHSRPWPRSGAAISAGNLCDTSDRPLPHPGPGPRESDQVELPGPADRLAAVGRRQLAVNALEVSLDRVDGDVHLAGDLRHVQHAGEVTRHLLLALGQRLDE